MLSNCVIKAIDVSRRSLAVAKRHALESKLSNIEYIDGDIMYLEHWSERFEVIECAGVLHHLPDPEAGLKILLNLLKPNGMILLGLYSRRARKPLMALRARVEPFTKNGMVAALHRARTIAKTDQTFHSILNLQDFFSLNGCLDLILHPRETSYGPLEISSLLQRHGLLFRGFELSDVQKSTFQMRNRHPEDILNLSKWEQYEIEHPDTFIGMYQLWAQKTVQ
jgi:SAM-dependent methyltransferase